MNARYAAGALLLFSALPAAAQSPAEGASALDQALARLEASHSADLRITRDGPTGPIATIRQFQAGPYQGAPEQAALEFLAEYGPGLGVLPGEGGWQPQRTSAWRGRQRVHLEQRHGGLPVLGGHAVVKLEASGHVGMVTLRFVEDLDLDLQPAFDLQAARQAVRDAVQGTLQAPPEPRLAILPDADGGGLIYQALVYTSAPPASWRVRLDARSGELLELADLRQQAQAQVYPASPANSKLTEVTLAGLPKDAQVLEGDYVEAWNVVSVATDGTVDADHLAVADKNGDFFYKPVDPDFEDPFVEVHTYYHLDAISRYFAETHGHEFLARTQVYGNFSYDGTAYDNAYFTTDAKGAYAIHLGQGTVDVGYDADVMDHEFGHGIVHDLTHVSEYISYPFGFDEYGFAIAPHAMNEGMADYWSSTVMGDPCCAEYFGEAIYGAGSCLRDLENSYTCPEDVYGEPHWDGQVVGGAMWDVREAVGAEAADAMAYGGLGAVSPTHSFQELGEALLEAAQDLVDDGVMSEKDLAATEAALEERGVLRCGRALEMTEDVAETSIWLGADIVEAYLGSSACTLARTMGIVFPLPFQYAFTTPAAEDDEPLSLSFELDLDPIYGMGFDKDDLDYGIYLRQGELVTFSTYNLGKLLGFDYTVVSGVDDYDLAFEDAPSSVELTPDGELPLLPETTYYLAISGLNCPSTNYELTASLHYKGEGDSGDSTVPGDSETPGDSQAPGDSEAVDDTGCEGDDCGKDEEGCGCQASRAPLAPVAGGLIVGLLGLLGLARRRQAR